ncbi:hypothetical protein ACHAPY_000754 [Fusarium culmorum]|uniref:Uncharacterized protein n=1 Tax=Fusarium culmorum TaxID=5516 RepID=A0A2T4H9J7_FUSCU|nr:hypothetical protein FCULG_00004359 [Fusarium culmorum]
MEETTRPELRNLMGSDRVSDVRSEKPGKSLRQSSPSWLRRVGFSISLLIIPVAYTLLLAMMGYLHGKKQSSFGDTVLEILSVASTLWPILFAAVLGPLLKSIALFRAERGSTLGSLEFLLTSQTTASALKNAMTMGWIGSWAILVLIVWSLSPLGGQAALRSLHRQQSPISTKTPAAYFLGNNESEIQTYYFNGAVVFQGASSHASYISDMRTTLAVSFSKKDTLVSHANSSSPHYNETITGLGGKREASRSGRRDLWRNVRIPFIELLPGYRSDDPHAWIPVSDDEIVPYASLIGLPIRNGSFERPGNATMMVHFHYMTLSCGKPFNGSEWVRNDSTAILFRNISSELPLQHQNRDAGAGYRNLWLNFPNTSTTTMHINFRPDSKLESKLQLVMGGTCFYPSPTPENIYNEELVPILRVCDISTSYIDMEVACNRLTADADLICKANRVRHAHSHPIKGNWTPLSNFRTPQHIFTELTYMGASQHIAEPTALEMYLRDPLALFQRVSGGYRGDYDPMNELGCFVSLPPEIMERRLATALNTAVMSSYPLRILTGGMGLGLEEQSHWQNITASWAEFDTDIYVLNKPWFVTTIVSTVILIICAVANVVIRQLIKAPDFLDNITGLTRDSPFIDLPEDGSGKSGPDRLATVKNVKVRIGDIYPEREVVRIALTTELNSPKLRWNRSYS